MTIPDRNISQSNKTLHSLGESLWNDFQALIEDYTAGWLNQDYLVNSDFQEILNLEKGISQVLEVEESFDAFGKFLTCEFIPEGSMKDLTKPLATTEETSPTQWLPFPSIYQGEGFPKGRGEVAFKSKKTNKEVSVISDREETDSIPALELLKFKSNLDTVPEISIQQESTSAISSVTNADITKESTSEQAQSQEISSLSNQYESEEEFTIELRGPKSSTKINSANLNGVKGLGELAQFLASEEPSGEITIFDGDTTDADITQKSTIKQAQSQEISSLSNQYESEEELAIELRGPKSPTKINSANLNGVKGLGELAQFLASEEPSGAITISDGDVNQEVNELESYFLQPENNLIRHKEAEILAEKPNDISLKSQGLFLDNEQSILDEQVELSQILHGEASNKKIDFTDEGNSKSFDDINLINSAQMEEEINLDTVIEALTQEINREYRRFYGG